MDIKTAVQGETAEITLAGDLVADSAEELQEQLASLGARGVSRFLLNLGSLNFIDSSGLNVFMGAHKQLRARQGRLVLLSPTEPVRRVLRITGAERKLEIAATREEGMALLERPGAADQG
jgi:anti-anti-sigma factor